MNLFYNLSPVLSEKPLLATKKTTESSYDIIYIIFSVTTVALMSTLEM